MKKEYKYYVYFMSSISGVLYIGMTNNLVRRVTEHKTDSIEGFTKEYKCHKLVYYESYTDVWEALEREKQLKKWRREKKESLMDEMNPDRRDLFVDLV